MTKRIAFAFVLVATACGASAAGVQGGIYSANLVECNRNAKTLCESIACENHYRAAEPTPRPPREMPAHCNPSDAGADHE